MAGLGLGVLLALRGLAPVPDWTAGAWPVFVHLVTVGWLTQLIFGVAWWLFPRHTPEAPYGPVWRGWAVWGLLNVGLLMRVLAEPAAFAGQAPGWGWLLVVSAASQWVAVALCVWSLWPRVKLR